MIISIFGLGYVGCVSAAILTKQGHNVIGVDINENKVKLINQGNCPIIEDQVGNLIANATKNGTLKASMDSFQAVQSSSISIICVGTPSKDDGSTNIDYIKNVILEIANSLKSKNNPHTIIVRSTLPPGTMEEHIIPVLSSAKKDIGICFNPEFLREGSAVNDYYNPPYIIAAVNNNQTEETIRLLYQDIKADLIITDYKTAEILKVTNNVFHALKVVFANEIGRFSEKYNLDGIKIMELVCRDKKLNISNKYLKPGSSFGGSCLPKDLRSLVYLARKKNIELPIIENIINSNELQLKNIITKIINHGSKNLGFVGLSFKSGTDDLRESPNVHLVEYFIGKGYNIKIYDSNVQLSKLIGKNKQVITTMLPHIDQLICSSIQEVSDHSDIVVITANEDTSEYFTKNQYIIDLR